MPGSPKWFLPSGFPTKTLYTPLFSPHTHYIPARLILLDFVTRTILSEEDKRLLIYNTDFSTNFVAVVNSAPRGVGGGGSGRTSRTPLPAKPLHPRISF